jgi:integrase
MPKIKKTLVDDARPSEKEYFVWDDSIAGFGLKVFPSGAKSYVFQYRTPQGLSRRATIGKHSETLTADIARAKAKEMRRTVEDGGDPLGAKQSQRDALTMDALFDLYLASAKFADKADSTRQIDKGRINRHLRPTLGKLYVQTLKPDAVRRAFGQIRDGNTAAKIKTGKRGLARVTGGEGAARMAVRLLRAILSWSIEEGYATSNPAAEVNVGSDGSRKTIMQGGDDYARLFRTLDTMEDEKRIRQAHADAIRLVALTGARRGEIACLQWRYVDLQQGVIVIPPTQHKTGRKTGEPRVIGLPAVAQAIITRQPEGKPDSFVFQPAKGEGAITLSAVWRKVREEAQLPEGIGLHGLRHSLASHLAMGGAQAAEIMTALGHRQLSTAQKYVHWAQDARVPLAERAASVAMAGLAESKGKTPAKMTPIKRGAK